MAVNYGYKLFIVKKAAKGSKEVTDTKSVTDMKSGTEDTKSVDPGLLVASDISSHVS
jgi:hypothetical protein